MSYSTIKTFLYTTETYFQNQRYDIMPGVKKIQICNYGIHSSTANKKVFAEIDIGNLLPNCEKLYCHIAGDNTFLVNSSLEFDVNNLQCNGLFHPIIRDVVNDEYIDTDIIVVIQLNLIY